MAYKEETARTQITKRAHHTMTDFDLIQQLERTLTHLARQGVRYLNLPADETLAKLLQECLTAENLADLSSQDNRSSIQSDNVHLVPEPASSAHPVPPPVVSTGETPGSTPPQHTASLQAGQAAETGSREVTTPQIPSAEQAPISGSGGTPSRAAQLVEQLRGPQVKPTETSTEDSVLPSEPEPLEQISTLESLSFQYRNCNKCGLSETRNRLVFGTGAQQPRLMFIGEGPGAEEDAQGLPFVGRAGQLLTGLILALGLTREDVYITNVVKCRPPGNRNPEPEEITTCRPILLRQIELLNPTLVVTLGNVPLKALRPDAEGITKERGKTFDFNGHRVLPTFHPSYLLRNQSAISECWQDFKQAFQTTYPQLTP